MQASLLLLDVLIFLDDLMKIKVSFTWCPASGGLCDPADGTKKERDELIICIHHEWSQNSLLNLGATRSRFFGTQGQDETRALMRIMNNCKMLRSIWI